MIIIKCPYCGRLIVGVGGNISYSVGNGGCGRGDCGGGGGRGPHK
jgi:hypothetical protein